MLQQHHWLGVPLVRACHTKKFSPYRYKVKESHLYYTSFRLLYKRDVLTNRGKRRMVYRSRCHQIQLCGVKKILIVLLIDCANLIRIGKRPLCSGFISFFFLLELKESSDNSVTQFSYHFLLFNIFMYNIHLQKVRI